MVNHYDVFTVDLKDPDGRSFSPLEIDQGFGTPILKGDDWGQRCSPVDNLRSRLI